jgi:hypothetical protein
VKKFTKEAKETILSDINQYTTLVRIDVKPVSIGTKFSQILGVTDVFDGDSKVIAQAPG